MGEYYDPDNAAELIASKLETIRQIRAFITAVTDKYEGMKSFDKALAAKDLTVADIKAEIEG